VNLGEQSIVYESSGIANILIVEDDPLHQDLTRRAFEHAGLKTRVNIVEDGEEAIHYLLNRGKFSNPRMSIHPDLVLLDLNIPKCNGIEVLKALHDADLKTEKPPVVVLSNSKDDRDIIAAYTYGAKVYIAKPADFDEFVIFVEKVLMNVLQEVLALKQARFRLKEQEKQLVFLSRMALAEEMSASIAHQINQPLTAIMSYASGCMHLMKRQHVAPKILEGMEHIISEVTRAGNIVRELRHFLQTGELDKKPYSINEIVEHTLQLTRQYCVDALVQVDVRLSDQVGMVLVDKIHLQQVIVNLIHNAVDAMRGAGDFLSLLSIRSMCMEDEIHLIVEDTGPGVADPSRVFHSFYTTKKDGMGVGLSIAKRIIDAHEGRLWLDQNYRRGARFVISLPTCSAEAETDLREIPMRF
jgi:signal transduction histidine kinase